LPRYDTIYLRRRVYRATRRRKTVLVHVCENGRCNETISIYTLTSQPCRFCVTFSMQQMGKSPCISRAATWPTASFLVTTAHMDKFANERNERAHATRCNNTLTYKSHGTPMRTRHSATTTRHDTTRHKRNETQSNATQRNATTQATSYSLCIPPHERSFALHFARGWHWRWSWNWRLCWRWRGRWR
jgi:hypothetical protein